MSGEYTKALQDIHAKLNKLDMVVRILAESRAENVKLRATIARLEKRIAELTKPDTRAQMPGECPVCRMTDGAHYPTCTIQKELDFQRIKSPS
jgi:hypothetical protein